MSPAMISTQTQEAFRERALMGRSAAQLAHHLEQLKFGEYAQTSAQ
jgi:hypothetical protein